MRFISFLLVFFLTVSSLDSYAQAYSLSQRENIMSAKKQFVCGLFKPSAGSRGWYVGIWHYKLPKEMVWVANRDRPLSKPIGELKVINTNLVLLDQYGNRVWWTNVTSTNLNKSPLIVELLDIGNLVLRYSNNVASYEWQSFDFPTDTLVSGMKLGWDAKTNINRTLRSWRGSDDPSSGEFTYAVEQNELAQSFIRKKGVPILRSDIWKTLNDVEETSETLSYGTYSITVTEEEATYFFRTTNESFFSVLRLSYDGLLNRTTWIPKPQQMWKPIMHILPDDACGSYNLCGANGLCRRDASPDCHCIDFFEAKYKEAWDLNDWTGGCERKTSLNCSSDGFVRLSEMKLPDISKSIVNRRIGLEECKDKCLEMCNCTAYANTNMKDGGSGCVIWFGDLIDLRKNNIAGQDLFVRLAATDAEAAAEANRKRKKKSTKMIMVIVGVAIVLLLGCIIFIMTCIWRRKKRPARAIAEAPIAATETSIGVLRCEPMDLLTVATATQHFSDSNKIGQGGFGIVYKGLLDNQTVAVKRLLRRSAQGMQGFANEVRLMASVQHINLVQVLGYCFEGDEMILVFEFLENSSLDTYIFDKTQSSKLDWEKRLLITTGIARGLLYLHQDSRNILLDKDMVPKIADFGMARLFGSDETEAATSTVVGTYGYMSPEYAIDRICSVKSDVFSFGVLVLEIISGRRNTEFFHTNEESLLNYVWRNWKEGKGLEMVDPVIVDSSPTFQPHEVLRSIQIGLLCVQECAEDRPAMSSVILMLTSERTEMEQPKLPGFSVGRFEIGSSSTKQQSWTVPDLTNSILEAR
ncbi:hypothetical protein EUTSA_v10028322mg [Eutrema salsugineum]|uniref:Receptor-like serine/threonine-protein kinase n=1 Tax=Eutrema salsugineum TaxID=72664 RepID=V4L8J2_EUTSA|nr:hypothetical protein EUTSA_v10028322mg [Eutrema salsugineum]